MTLRDIQRALRSAGFDPGPADGAMGPITRAALKSFQKTHGLVVDGIVGPATLAALFPQHAGALAIEPPWFAEGKRRMGLHEELNYSTLMSWLRSDGKALGDIRKLPWCGDFVQTCIALTLPDELQPANPYYATNWARFGRALQTPAIGAVLAFEREGGGHVGFYAGEDASTYSVLGGNQGNRVSIVRVAKARCIAVRWPLTYPLPVAGRVAGVGGALSTNEA